MNPTCPTGCASELPATLYDKCNPEINAAEIEKIFVGEPGTVFADYAETAATAIERGAFLTEFLALITAGTIQELTVIGEKPAPADNLIAVSGGRSKQGVRDHTLPFDIDETNIVNHDWVRKIECGFNGPIWYQTSGGLFFGGAAGIFASLTASMVIAKDRKANILFSGLASWKSKFTEERTISPLV